MTTEHVRIEGLRELRRALKTVSADAPKELRDDLKEIAEAFVVKVRAKVPARSGRARASYQARSTASGASVALGGNAAAHAPWLDFGGSTKIDASKSARVSAKKAKRKLDSHQAGRGRAYREFIKGGRYFYPTLAEESRRIDEQVDASMRRIAERNGFETRKVA